MRFEGFDTIMSKMSIDSDLRLYEYLLKVSTRESELKSELREETAALPNGRMQISPDQGQFMALLAKLVGAKRTIEIGTFTGYSAWCVAEALPSDGRLVACDTSEEWTSIGRSYWVKSGVSEKIDLRIGPALDTLGDLLDEEGPESYDFAFIDADKANYDNYYEKCLQLVRIGGLIVVDNALWGGQVMDDSYQDEDTVALRNLNEKIRDDQRVDASLLSIGDGLYLARKR